MSTDSSNSILVIFIFAVEFAKKVKKEKKKKFFRFIQLTQVSLNVSLYFVSSYFS